MISTRSWQWLLSVFTSAFPGLAANSTIYNPIFPGFYPDPSCIFVAERDNTFFCASSSFNAFPGIPIHASQDLQDWRLIGHVLNRREQLPRLAETNRSTSGIWAPTLRFHDDKFWLVTTLVDDDRPQADFSRWDNIIFKGKDPFDSSSWSKAIHFNFTGYDPEPFWDDDGKVYITGAHAWQVGPYIEQAEVNLDTGEVGPWYIVWNGTGGLAPEGPHIYKKDGWYYLLAAEGGTGLNHMVTMARSKSVKGPYESYVNNPVLSNANTTSLFQTVGHADLFHDSNGNWWAVALSTRSGPSYLHYPMGRETVLTPVSWPPNTFPTFTPISGTVSAWPLPSPPPKSTILSSYPPIHHPDTLFFPSNTTIATTPSLPPHFLHWRFPPPTSLITTTPQNILSLSPSKLNLTALNGNYAGPQGQSFIARRQQDTLFTYSVHLEYSPSLHEEEAGITAFLTQNHHLDMGIVYLPSSAGTDPFPGAAADELDGATDILIPHARVRGESYVPVPKTKVMPLPTSWRGEKLSLQIRAENHTHYTFALGLAREEASMTTVWVVSNEPVSWGFTGVLLGVYSTSNGGNGTTPAYFSDWKYISQGQYRE